jgi:hypothetical protein
MELFDFVRTSKGPSKLSHLWLYDRSREYSSAVLQYADQRVMLPAQQIGENAVFPLFKANTSSKAPNNRPPPSF